MIFLDIDGVICNWTLGFCKLAKIEYPIDVEFLEFDWAKKQVAPRNIWSYRMDEFYWSELETYGFADHLIDAIESIDKDFRFLTSAPSSAIDHSAFVHGRSRWVNKNFGQKYLEKLIITCGDKSFCASPDNVLIDDKPKNVENFEAKGGRGFLWKECNLNFNCGLKQIHELELFLIRS